MMNNFCTNFITNFKNFFYHKKVVGIAIFFAIIGLFALNNILVSMIVSPVDISSYHINEYSLNFFNEKKYLTFMQYGTSIVVIALSIIGVYFLFKREDLINKIKFNSLYLLLFIPFNLFLLFFNTGKVKNLVVFSIIWLFFIYQIFLKSFLIDYLKPKTLNIIKNVIYSIVSIGVIIQFFCIFYPFVFQKIKIMNEFYDIPEFSIIKNANGNDVMIDNNDYINKLHINGIAGKYDIRYPNKKMTDNCVPFTNTSYLQSFIKNQSYSTSDKKNISSNYFYFKNSQLCLIGKMTDVQYDKIMKNTEDNINKNNFIKLRNNAENQYAAIRYFNDSTDNVIRTNFINNNAREMNWQILNRYFIHHHNHMVAPINELILHRDINKIYFQYGKLNTLFLSKIIDKTGGFNFTKYINITYSFYYIYFGCFIILAFLFFKRKEYFIAWLLSSIAGYNFITDEFLRIAPGVNPLRHFFDIFVFALLYWFLKTKNKVSLILILILSMFAILNEVHTGMFIMLSIFATLFVKNFITDKPDEFEVGVLLQFPILGFICKLIGSSSVDYTVNYFKLGLLGFQTPKVVLVLIIVTVISIYALLLRGFLSEKKNNLLYFYLAIVFYIQGILFYYIWGSDFNHLLVYFPIISFVGLAFIQLLDEENVEKHPKVINICIIVAMLFSINFYVDSLCKYYPNYKTFKKIFKTHVVYDWNLPHTNFKSTMNPEYFADSVELIKKYSKEPAIYMISKYDTILPLIAEKYSDMPYFEVSNFLTSQKEIDNNISTIRTIMPQYLFIDKDIDRDYAQDIIYNEQEFNYLFYESMWRYQRLSLMKDIFNAIKADYEPVESSYLLTVWKRKDK